MQNPSVTFTCHVCGTVDEAQRARAKETGDGVSEDGVTPALLSRLSKDGHFSLQNYLVSPSRLASLRRDPLVAGACRRPCCGFVCRSRPGVKGWKSLMLPTI